MPLLTTDAAAQRVRIWHAALQGRCVPLFKGTAASSEACVESKSLGQVEEMEQKAEQLAAWHDTTERRTELLRTEVAQRKGDPGFILADILFIGKSGRSSFASASPQLGRSSRQGT